MSGQRGSETLPPQPSWAVRRLVCVLGEEGRRDRRRTIAMSPQASYWRSAEFLPCPHNKHSASSAQLRPPVEGARRRGIAQRRGAEMAARSFDGLGVSEIPLKVPLKGTDFGRAMQQLMQGEANAKNILIRKR